MLYVQVWENTEFQQWDTGVLSGTLHPLAGKSTMLPIS